MKAWLFAIVFVASVAGCSWFTTNREDIGNLVCEILPVFGRVCASPSALPQIRAEAVNRARLLDAGTPPP